MNRSFSVAEYQVSAKVKVEKKQYFAEAYCPICGALETADDHEYGAEYALDLVKLKMQTHMRQSHDIPSPIE